MINRYNDCAYNTSVMPRKIYCTYSTSSTSLHIQSARTRCRSQGGVGGNAGRGKSILACPPRKSWFIEMAGTNPGLIHHHDFSLPVEEKSSTRSLLRPSRCSRHVSATSDNSSAINARDTHIKRMLRFWDRVTNSTYVNFGRKLAREIRRKKKLVQADRNRENSHWNQLCNFNRDETLEDNGTFCFICESLNRNW